MTAAVMLLERFRLLIAERRAMARLRGLWYRLYYPLRGVPLRVGARFHVRGRLRIRGGARVVIGDLVFFDGDVRIEGPGEVVIGSNVYLTKGLRIIGPGTVILGDRVCLSEMPILQTQHRSARILIDDGTSLRGAHFNCVREISVGKDCMIAPAMLLDTDFHSSRVDRRSPDSPVRVSPVCLGDNVWVGEQAALLPGTKIGKNSVVGFGAICMREYPDNVIILGNPARVAAPIPDHDAGCPGSMDTARSSRQYVPLRELRSP